MNTRKPSRAALFLTLALHVASVLLSLGQNPPTDPMQELMRQREAEANRRDSNIEGPTAADELFANPDWRNKMATRIAILIENSRYNGPVQEKEDVWQKLRETDPDGLKPETQAAWMAMMTEQSALRQKNDPKHKVGGIFSDLVLLKDPRVVPLIAPALMENSLAGIGGGDYAVPAPQQAAADKLLDLVSFKVITVADPKPVYDIAGWRSWWKENKLNFDQVPEPLRAIDEGRITKTMDPNIVSTPPKKPSPEKTAELQAQAAAAKAKAKEAGAPPKAEPDKPAPAVATVTHSGDISIWLPVAAASAAILLAAGIWFYSRASRV